VWVGEGELRVFSLFFLLFPTFCLSLRFLRSLGPCCESGREEGKAGGREQGGGDVLPLVGRVNGSVDLAAWHVDAYVGAYVDVGVGVDNASVGTCVGRVYHLGMVHPLKVRVFECRLFGCLDVRGLGCSGVRVSGCLGLWTSARESVCVPVPMPVRVRVIAPARACVRVRAPACASVCMRMRFLVPVGQILWRECRVALVGPVAFTASRIEDMSQGVGRVVLAGMGWSVVE
jgi:hypothetical protein